MNRFFWTSGELFSDEARVLQQEGVGLQEGGSKTSFGEGRAVLTSHRLMWLDRMDSSCRMALPLQSVLRATSEKGGIGKSDKIILQLGPPRPGDQERTPVAASSSGDVVKLSFKRAGVPQFLTALQETLKARCWLATAQHAASGARRHVGIVGIERSMAAKQEQVDATISQAFEDLGALMRSARDMVSLSNQIAEKLRDRQGELTDDETVKFKSYLLSLGISDPVTRNTHPGGSYFSQLARELSKTLEPLLRQRGGAMPLADAFCVVNRARGLELLSPEDFVAAARLMAGLNLPVVLKTFPSGVLVLQLASQSDDEALQMAAARVAERGSLSAAEFARAASLPVILAQERLLSAEEKGLLCRDDTMEGLRFFPNRFAKEV